MNSYNTIKQNIITTLQNNLASSISNGHTNISRVLQDILNANYERYFDIDSDGVVSLKSKYRGSLVASQAANYPNAISDNGVGINGSLIDELPENLIIPDIVDGQEVKGLHAASFAYNLKVKELTIPNTVYELPDRLCAQANNLKVLHNTEHITKVGTNIILNTQVKSLSFPHLTEVAERAFNQGLMLYDINIGDNLTQIPNGMLCRCQQLHTVKGGKYVTSIGEKAFMLTYNLKELPFLSQVTSMGDLAFHRSSVHFDWSSIPWEIRQNFGPKSYPLDDNVDDDGNYVDYWSGVEFTPCENPLVTIMDQSNPEWKAIKIYNGGTNGIRTYDEGCATFSILHIHSALTGKHYNHPNEFMEDLNEIDPILLTAKGDPASNINAKNMLTALGYKITDCPLDGTIDKNYYKQICDALSRGAYVYTEVTTYVLPEDDTQAVNYDNGHAVVIYGINKDGEMLVLDSSGGYTSLLGMGIDERTMNTYHIPHPHLTGPGSYFMIVEKQ